MPFLVIGATTIPVFAEPVEAAVERFDDQVAAWDGTMLVRRRARKRAWQCTTPYVSQADATTYRNALEATPPLAASGDLTGSMDVHATITAEVTHTVGAVRMVALRFTLREV